MSCQGSANGMWWHEDFSMGACGVWLKIEQQVSLSDTWVTGLGNNDRDQSQLGGCQPLYTWGIGTRLRVTNKLTRPNGGGGRGGTDKNSMMGSDTSTCWSLRSIQVCGTITKDHLAAGWMEMSLASMKGVLYRGSLLVSLQRRILSCHMRMTGIFLQYPWREAICLMRGVEKGYANRPIHAFFHSLFC